MPFRMPLRLASPAPRSTPPHAQQRPAAPRSSLRWRPGAAPHIGTELLTQLHVLLPPARALQETVVVIPEDQAQLDEAQLEEEHTMIIRASDPNAPDNIQDYNFAEQVFKPRPSDAKNQVAMHFDQSYRFVAPHRCPQRPARQMTPTVVGAAPCETRWPLHLACG
jgi:hypothetical protein